MSVHHAVTEPSPEVTFPLIVNSCPLATVEGTTSFNSTESPERVEPATTEPGRISMRKNVAPTRTGREVFKLAAFGYRGDARRMILLLGTKEGVGSIGYPSVVAE